MSRFRRKKTGLDVFIDVLPPLAALVFLAVFFVPGFKQLLGTLFVVTLCLVAAGVVGLVVWAVWRKWKVRASEPLNSPPDSARAEPSLVVPPREAISTKATWTRELLSQLEWKRYEDVVAAYSRELGYEAKTTRIGADGGVDVQLFQNGQPQPVMIIQCKAWDAYKVGVKPVRELFGVMAADKVANGAFFTTGDFTAEAETWARDKNVDLVNGQEFISRIRQMSTESQAKLLSLATQGDYTTPTCPSCGIKMVERVSRKGPSEGNHFYGCPNFSRGCKHTFKFPGATPK
jgi:restriction system protein